MRFLRLLENITFWASIAASIIFALRTGKLKIATGILFSLITAYLIIFYMIIPAIREGQTGDDHIWDSQYLEPGPTMFTMLFLGFYCAIYGIVCWLIRAVYRKFFKSKTCIIRSS